METHNQNIKKLCGLLLFSAFASITHVVAQKSIINASYAPFPSPGVPAGDVLELLLDAKADSSKIDKINLQDVRAGTTRQVAYRVVGGIVVIDNALQPFGFATAPDTLEILFRRNPQFLLSNPVSVTILFKPKDTVTPPALSSAQIEARVPSLRPKALEDEAPKGREDAEIYLSGESVTAVGSKPVFSVDVKYDRPLVPLHETSETTLGPYLSYKGSTNPKADPDQLRAGLKFSGLIWNKSDSPEKPCLLCFVQWEATGELEANRKFTVKNLITNDRFNFNFRTFVLSSNKEKPVKDAVLMRFIPFIGAELGRNLSSPIPREERGIARVVAGAHLNFKFPAPIFSAFGIKNGVLIENSFTHRMLLASENAYDKGSNGQLVIRSFGRKPHSHFTSKFSFLFNDFFGPTLGYEWGDQPPLYNRVNHQLKFGFTFFKKTKAPN